MNPVSILSPETEIRKDELFPDPFCCIGLVAPAGRIPREEYEAAAGFLSGLGLRLFTGKSIFKGDRISYVSAPAADRADDFNELIRNPEIQAIYCLRGGYGCIHLLDKLDWNALKRRKLPVVGYSDITVLHAAMQSKHAGIAVSACMALHLQKDSRNAVFRRNFQRAWKTASGENGPFRRIAPLQSCSDSPGVTEAPLFCGNLTTLASLCGTGYLPRMKGKVIFLEDIAEPVRKLDRTLMQLKLNGFFDGCAGIVFGDFKQCGDAAERSELFRRFSAMLSVPVFSGLHYGHCTRSISLVCGESARIRNNTLYLRDPVFSAEKS